MTNAEQPFTEEDVRRLADDLHLGAQLDDSMRSLTWEDWVTVASAALVSLVEAGRLLPLEVETQLAIRRRGITYPLSYPEEVEQFVGDPAWTVLKRWVGPWVPVGVEEQPNE